MTTTICLALNNINALVIIELSAIIITFLICLTVLLSTIIQNNAKEKEHLAKLSDTKQYYQTRCYTSRNFKESANRRKRRGQK